MIILRQKNYARKDYEGLGKTLRFLKKKGRDKIANKLRNIRKQFPSDFDKIRKRKEIADNEAYKVYNKENERISKLSDQSYNDKRAGKLKESNFMKNLSEFRTMRDNNERTLNKTLKANEYIENLQKKNSPYEVIKPLVEVEKENLNDIISTIKNSTNIFKKKKV